MIRCSSVRAFAFFGVLLCFILGCKRNSLKEHLPLFKPDVIPARGYVVPADSIRPPSITAVGAVFEGVNCKPAEFRTNTNIRALNRPEIRPAGLPLEATPGQNGLGLPQTTTPVHRPIRMGVPEINIAKDAHISDHNPCSFSSFSILQGLKHIQATCLLLDHLGCLWIGTDGGGVSRYDGRQFVNYTEQTGLCGNRVSSIFQDKQGNIWIGFWSGGVSRFDGRYFTNYHHSEGFTDNPVMKIIQDKAENLWFCTLGGIVKYNGTSFVHYTEKEGLLNNDVLCAMEDHKGNLWFGVAGGLSRFDGQTFYHYTLKNGLKSAAVYAIREERGSGLIWFGTDGGLISSFDGSSFAHYQLNTDFSITSILEDNKHKLWFASDGAGLYQMDTKQRTLTQFSEQQGLNNVFFSDLVEDSQGTIWCGSLGGGVVKYAGNLFTHYTVKEGISSNIVFNILTDRKGNLWFATRGGGLSQLDNRKKVFRHYTTKDGLGHHLESNSVFDLLEDRQGNIWCATWGGGVSKYDGRKFVTYTTASGLCDNDIRCIYQDRSGAIWFGSWQNGVSKLDAEGRFFTNYSVKEGLTRHFVSSILEDMQGNIWITTRGGGLTCIDQRQQKITHYTVREGFFSNDVSSIVEDNQGQLWISTMGKGLIRLDQDRQRFTRFGEKEGLVNGNILSSMIDSQQNIWLGTRGGLSKLSREALKQLETALPAATEDMKQSPVLFKNLDYGDGFWGVSCYFGAIHQDKDGDIWVGASDRLTVYHADNDHPDTQAPPVELSNVNLYNEPLPWAALANKKDSVLTLSNGVKVGRFRFAGLLPWKGVPDQLSLTYDNNFLNFHFMGATTRSPQKLRYQYKLEGIDANWSGLNTLAEAPYGNLPPRDYIFKVRAVNADGYWSKTLSYPFTIRPPWWNTWWAWLLYAALFAAVIYGIIRYRISVAVQKVKVLEAIRTKISSDLHDDVGSILSGLAMQSQMMAYTAPPEIKASLHELSNISRDAMERMRDIVWVIDSRKDKYENLIDRMRTFAEKNLVLKNIDYQFEVNNIDLKKNIDPEKRQNIYLIFKEAVANIMKHSNANRVNILLIQEKNQMRLSIQDNGTQQPSESDGLGRHNMTMRAKTIGGVLKSYYAEGFQVVLECGV